MRSGEVSITRAVRIFAGGHGGRGGLLFKTNSHGFLQFHRGSRPRASAPTYQIIHFVNLVLGILLFLQFLLVGALSYKAWFTDDRTNLLGLLLSSVTFVMIAFLAIRMLAVKVRELEETVNKLVAAAKRSGNATDQE